MKLSCDSDQQTNACDSAGRYSSPSMFCPSSIFTLSFLNSIKSFVPGFETLAFFKDKSHSRLSRIESFFFWIGRDLALFFPLENNKHNIARSVEISEENHVNIFEYDQWRFAYKTHKALKFF
jgi:hypothetical protein